MFSGVRTGQPSAPWRTYTHACFMYGRSGAYAGWCLRVRHHLYFVRLSPAFCLSVRIKRERTRPYLQVVRAETKVDGLPPASRSPSHSLLERGATDKHGVRLFVGTSPFMRGVYFYSAVYRRSLQPEHRCDRRRNHDIKLPTFHQRQPTRPTSSWRSKVIRIGEASLPEPAHYPSTTL